MGNYIENINTVLYKIDETGKMVVKTNGITNRVLAFGIWR